MTDAPMDVHDLKFAMAPMGHGSSYISNKFVDDIIRENAQMGRKMNTILIKPTAQTKGYKMPTPWPAK
ncbi:hypothetical protein ACYSUW_14305 [Pseudomonas frederiksbergensis]